LQDYRPGSVITAVIRLNLSEAYVLVEVPKRTAIQNRPRSWCDLRRICDWVVLRMAHNPDDAGWILASRFCAVVGGACGLSYLPQHQESTRRRISRSSIFW